MKAPNDDFPNEIWVMKYKDTQIWGTKRAKDDESIRYIRAETINKYKKGYNDGYEDGVRVEHKRGIEMRERRL